MKLLAFLSALLIASPLFAKEVVVLVPGFFNSFAPEYFSQDIVNSFEQKGFKVYVIKGLNPVGTIEENGERLEKILLDIEKNEKARVSFNIVGHSAGGFYTLFVSNRKKVDVKNIFTVATPYKGVEFIQKWLDNSLLFSVVTSLVKLEGLVQMTPPGVQKFLASVKVAPKTKLVVFGGYQRRSLDIWDARNMSGPLMVTSQFISEDSDGIVGYSSALGFAGIKTTEGQPATQMRDPSYFLALEHWEQVLSADSFLFLAIRNTGYIRQEQIRFYSGLADLLNQLNSSN